MIQPRLTPENYTKGLLIDEELMAGVTQNPQQPGQFVAYVLRHTTGEYLGYQPLADLGEALEMINRIPRGWVYEATGGCGNGKCGKSGGCAGGGCGKLRRETSAPGSQQEPAQTQAPESCPTGGCG